MNEIKFNTIEEAIEDFKNGKPIIVADDEDRENEGDVILWVLSTAPNICEEINHILYYHYVLST